MFSMQQIVLNKWLLICSLFSVLTVMIVKYYEKTHIIWLLLLALLSEAGLIYGYIQLLGTRKVIQVLLKEISTNKYKILEEEWNGKWIKVDDDTEYECL